MFCNDVRRAPVFSLKGMLFRHGGLWRCVCDIRWCPNTPRASLVADTRFLGSSLREVRDASHAAVGEAAHSCLIRHDPLVHCVCPLKSLYGAAQQGPAVTVGAAA